MRDKPLEKGQHHGKGGRPLGSKNALSLMAIEEAKKTGMLPHEWLLSIAQGHPIKQMMPVRIVDGEGVETLEWEEREIYPGIDTRIDAAKSSAQFYAPRLSSVQVKSTGGKGILRDMDNDTLEETLEELRRATED